MKTYLLLGASLLFALTCTISCSDIFGDDEVAGLGSCTIRGTCYNGLFQSECETFIGSFKETTCSGGSFSNPQFCYVDGGCELIGTYNNCDFKDAAACRSGGGTTRNYGQCPQSNTFGCYYVK